MNTNRYPTRFSSQLSSATLAAVFTMAMLMGVNALAGAQGSSQLVAQASHAPSKACAV